MKSVDLGAALGDCQLSPPAPAALIAELRIPIPADYADLLAKTNGLEGFVSPGQYLVLWSVEKPSDLNEAYAVPEFLPDAVLIGTDGADTGFGFDSCRNRYFKTPLVGMRNSATTVLGGSFDEFLEALKCS